MVNCPTKISKVTVCLLVTLFPIGSPSFVSWLPKTLLEYLTPGANTNTKKLLLCHDYPSLSSNNDPKSSSIPNRTMFAPLRHWIWSSSNRYGWSQFQHRKDWIKSVLKIDWWNWLHDLPPFLLVWLNFLIVWFWNQCRSQRHPNI